MKEIEKMFEKISESIETSNHNSTRTCEAMEKIADSIDTMEKCISAGFARNSAEHKNILNQMNKLWIGLILSFVILGGLVGIKIALEGLLNLMRI